MLTTLDRPTCVLRLDQNANDNGPNRPLTEQAVQNITLYTDHGMCIQYLPDFPGTNHYETCQPCRCCLSWCSNDTQMLFFFLDRMIHFAGERRSYPLDHILG